MIGVEFDVRMCDAWRLSNIDACVPRDSKRKPYLQILASVYGNRDYLSLPRFGVDMVTSIDAL